MPQDNLILSASGLERALTRIAHEIAERNDDSREGVCVVGVQRGGVHLADRLAALLGGIWKVSIPTGNLDVSMHRDDLDDNDDDEIRDEAS